MFSGLPTFSIVVDPWIVNTLHTVHTTTALNKTCEETKYLESKTFFVM